MGAPRWFDNVIAFPFSGITMVKNSKGEWKKMFKPPNGWDKLTRNSPETMFKDGAALRRGTMVLTGEKSGITVLDFDNMEVYEEMRRDFPWLENQPRVRSRRGVHVYCKYNGNIHQPHKDQGLDIDVQGGSKNASTIIAPPTTYQYEDEDGRTQTFEYKWERQAPLDDIPEDIIAYINPPETRVVNDTTNRAPATVTLNNTATTMADETTEIVALLVKHEGEVGYNYSDWFAILCACNAMGRAEGDLDKWRKHAHTISKASTKYDAAITDTKFDEGNKFGKYTMGTLKYYARRADPEGFRAIAIKHIRLEEKVIFEERELRDYFLRSWGDNILCFKCDEKVLYLWLEDESKWIVDNGNKLKHYVIEQCHTLFEVSIESWREQATEASKAYLALKSSRKDDDPEVQKAQEREKYCKIQYRTICNTKLFFGDAKTRAVCNLIMSSLATQALDENLFDERREIFAFNNIAFNLKTKEWYRPIKYDYVLTTCGHDWREPTPDEYDRVRK
eukprot:6779243-Prymnesium_polylepis.1